MKGSEITKYYFAGATRIAMRKYTIPQSMKVEYFLSDHLGSTSITTDADGNKISEMRYKPWGEVRYAWTATQTTTPAYELTRYTFTGQYSYMDDITTQNVTEGFGLMHYNARMYDPALGRFTSADTIIPSHQGVQGWDRFAYVNNNPVRYTDPSGHSCVPCLLLIGIGVIYATFVIYTTPHMQELGQQAVAGIENAVQMGDRKVLFDDRIIKPDSELSGDPTQNLCPPGFEWLCVTLVVAIFTGAVTALCIRDDIDCLQFIPKIEPAALPTNTIPPTNTPTVPPTSTPTVPPTSTPTVPPTSTPTVPPSLPPNNQIHIPI
jgi:RHS repeat-associated protein